METITDIGLPTIIICFGIYFVVRFFRRGASIVWGLTTEKNQKNKIIRGIIKYGGSMWITIWPSIIGGVGVGYTPGIPIPDYIKALGEIPGPSSIIYGAFCGLIASQVVKATKDMLDKKGIDISVDDLEEATVAVKKASVQKKEDAVIKRKSMMPKPPPKEEDDEPETVPELPVEKSSEETVDENWEKDKS